MGEMGLDMAGSAGKTKRGNYSGKAGAVNFYILRQPENEGGARCGIWATKQALVFRLPQMFFAKARRGFTISPV